MTVEVYTPDVVHVTEPAIDALKDIMASMGSDASEIVGLRVFVTGGGCSGFSYGFSFVRKSIEEDDTVIECGALNLLVDPMSLQYLTGATVDYKTGLHGSQFSVQNNPNATTTCGCGNSFS